MKRMERGSRSRSRSPYVRSKRVRATPPRRYSDSPPPSPPPDKYRKSPPAKYRDEYHTKRSSSRSDKADLDYSTPVKYYKRRPTYKILCVTNLNSKISDGAIKEALNAEFKKFFCIGVKIVHEPAERLAYVYFKDYEDAREAKHAKTRLYLFDKQIVIEAVYLSPEPPVEASRRGRSSSKRSYTPEPYYSHRSYRAPSPLHSPYTVPLPPTHELEMIPHYIPGARRYPPVIRRPPPHYYAEPIPPHYEHHVPAYAPIQHSYHVPQHHMQQHHIPRHMPSQDGYYFYEKEKKFPNYLQHIPPEDDPMATRTLFVGNLELGIPEPELRKMFAAFGNVEDIDIKRPLPGQGNAYAFVKFQNLDMAHRAKVELSGQYLGKFQCKIGYGKANPTTRLWVGGLGVWTSLAQLEREFDRFGAIKKIDYTKGETCAYISYDSIDAATAACAEMRGFPLGGPDKRLRIDFAIDPNAAPTVPPAPGLQTITTIPVIADGAIKRSPGPSYYTPRSDPPDHFWPDEGAAPSGGFYERGPRGLPSFSCKQESFPSGPPTPSKYRWTRSEKGMDGQRGPNSDSDPGRYMGGDRDDSPRRRRKLSPLSPGKSSQGIERVSVDGSELRATNQECVDDVKVAVFQTIKCLTEFSSMVPMNWHGSLVLKNSAFPIKMYSFSGDVGLVETMMRDVSGGPPLLRITQRLRLDQPKLEDVAKRMTSSGPNGQCLLLGLPAPIQPQEPESNNPNATQQRPLRNLVTYLKQKEAAGVISLPPTKGDCSMAEPNLLDVGLGGGKDSQGVLYAFPPGPFANDLLRQVTPNMTEDSFKEDHLVILVVKGPI